MRSVIRVLTEKNIHPTEIHRKVVEVYGEGVTNEGGVRKWFRLFKERRTMRGAAARHRQYTLVTRTVQKSIPPYSSYLASRDYHLFLHLKKFLAGQILRSDQETKDALQDWLEGLATSLCNAVVLKLVPRYANYVNLHGDCVEKFFNVYHVSIKFQRFLHSTVHAAWGCCVQSFFCHRNMEEHSECLSCGCSIAVLCYDD